MLEEIASSDKCNVGGVQIDDETKEIQAVAYNYARLERVFFDKGLEKDFEILQAAAPPRATWKRRPTRSGRRCRSASRFL